MALPDLANGAVTTGYSYPVVALYSANGGNVSYSNGRDLARGVSVDVDIETQGEDNTFCTNNGAAEEAPQIFRRGTLNLVVDGLLRSAEDLLLGALSTDTVTIGTGENAQTVAVHDNDDNQKIPYVGYGNVIRRQSAGTVFYQGVVYPKLRFAQFSPGAATQEEDIDWQTQELSARILRDDSAKHRWQRVTDPVETELEAYNAIRVMLDMPIASAVPGNGAIAST